jgi:mRNA-degrading endonuclease toxin of MazEF toxin-antitoxin module
VRRGEVWQYTPVLPRPGVSTTRLVVSANVINESEIPWVLGVHLVDHDPESVLAQRIGDYGWAVVTTVERVVRSRLGQQLGTATPEEMEQVDIALKACLDLD